MEVEEVEMERWRDGEAEGGEVEGGEVEELEEVDGRGGGRERWREGEVEGPTSC